MISWRFISYLLSILRLSQERRQVMIRYAQNGLRDISRSMMYIRARRIKGTFDVNDLMNNTIGAMIGGLIAVAVINGTQRLKAAKDKGSHR